jgi:hypothetical protein
LSLSWLLLTLQAILSIVLLVAAAEKTLRSEEFFAALRLSHLLAGSIGLIGAAVPMPELMLAPLAARARNAVEGLAFFRSDLSRIGRARLS